MRVLLIHPGDEFPEPHGFPKLDLIVDLARAPHSTYEKWSREFGCHVIGLYDFAQTIEDLLQVKALLALDATHLLDEDGVDWWDLASYLMTDALVENILLRRVAEEIGVGSELVGTRYDSRVELLGEILGVKPVYFASRSHSFAERLRHYRSVVSRHDRFQIAQVIADKWDAQHQIRRRFGRQQVTGDERFVLLPSAYINISRTAIAYAKLLPKQQFLLVHARDSGKLAELPANVRSAALHPYYKSSVPTDLVELLQQWERLKAKLIANSKDMHRAESLGAFKSIPDFIRRGLSARDAWKEVFVRHNIVGCLCADDTNAYTRLALVLAELRKVASVACHHGALDYRMAVKILHGDTYLAKSEMEKDYLENVCGVTPKKITLGGPALPTAATSRNGRERTWLVFFTEPYDADGWRMVEVYRDLLPKLLGLARLSGLRLVLKLHPFESVKSHRNLHGKYLSAEQMQDFDIIAGPLSEESWSKIRYALTVQSSVALECAQREIPVFLCGWLAARYGGYLRQFAKFGAGEVLENADALATIPQRIASYKDSKSVATLGTMIEPTTLRKLVSGAQEKQVRETVRSL